MVNQKTLTITCGDLEAILDIGRFGPGGRSLCVLFGGHWISLTKFEDMAGKSASHNWKRSIRHKGKPLIDLITTKKLKLCPKGCVCDLCTGQKESEQPDKAEESKAKLPPPQLALVKAQDTDSDSGISVSSALKIDVAFEDDEDMAQNTNGDVKELDYITLTQEALLSLGQNGGECGCSQLNVLLYILNKYKPTESVQVVNDKVKNSLRFLSRMGVVDRISIDGNGEKSDDLMESDEENEPLDADVSDEVKKKTSATPDTASTAGAKSSAKTKSKSKALAASNNLLKTCSPKSGDKPIKPAKMMKLSPALAAVCHAKKLTRQEVVKAVWKYVKAQKLQDPKQKTVIRCDDKLKAVTKKKKIVQTELFGHIKKHLSDL